MGPARNPRPPPGRGRRRAVCAILLALVAPSVSSAVSAAPKERPAAPSPVLVAYSFDDELVDTGPDTFRVFENARGTVQLSDLFRVSGTRSVEIRDRAGDGDFPELQGRFPLRREGTLFLHFALLVADPSQELNVALAGPAGFRLGRGGIAFWLAVRDGELFHTSDSIPRRLLEVEPFTWYEIDLEYRVAAGVYDLRVRREGEASPRVALEGVPNAASLPGSAVDTFSFIGDPGTDRSNVDYYVDDVVVASTREAVQLPFVAPGRRHTFVDLLERYRGAPPRLECVPAQTPGDLGLDAARLAALRTSGQLEALAGALAEGTKSAGSTVGAVLDWRAGCGALAAEHFGAALGSFDRAARILPSPLVTVSRAMALSGLGRREEAAEVLARVPSSWRDDPRYGLALARIGAREGHLEEAERWAEWSRDAAARAEAASPPDAAPPDTAVARLAAREAFYLEMLAGNFDAAFDLAVSAERLETQGSPDRDRNERRRWTELAGDAAFAAGHFDEAERRYRAAGGEADTRLLLKLADLAWKRGDRDAERRLREAVYGSLRPPVPRAADPNE